MSSRLPSTTAFCVNAGPSMAEIAISNATDTITPFVRINITNLPTRSCSNPFSRCACQRVSFLRQFSDRVFARVEAQPHPISDRTRLALLARCHQESHVECIPRRAQQHHRGFEEHVGDRKSTTSELQS